MLLSSIQSSICSPQQLTILHRIYEGDRRKQDTSLSGDKEPREQQTQVYRKPTHTERYIHLHFHEDSTTHLQQQNHLRKAFRNSGKPSGTVDTLLPLLQEH